MSWIFCSRGLPRSSPADIRQDPIGDCNTVFEGRWRRSPSVFLEQALGGCLCYRSRLFTSTRKVFTIHHSNFLIRLSLYRMKTPHLATGLGPTFVYPPSTSICHQILASKMSENEKKERKRKKKPVRHHIVPLFQ